MIPDYANNPMPAAAVHSYAETLRKLLSALGWEVVDAALIGEREADLLGTEREVVDRFREFLHSRVAVPFELDGNRGRALAVLDAFKDQFSSGAGHALTAGESPG